MEDHPDSALAMLNRIEYPKELNNPQFYKYTLLLTQAKDKNFMDIRNDSIVKDITDYYIKVKDYNNAATSMFYWGRINFYKENYQTAINEYLTAINLAQKDQSFNLLGLIHDDIGTIYRKQLNYDKCIEHYLLAKENFSKAGNKKNENKILNRIGNIYLRMDPPLMEKAFNAYNQAFEFAKQEQDTTQMALCLNNISVAYRDMKDYDNAKKYTFESIALDRNNDILLKNYGNLTKIHLAAKQLDSALFCLNSISQIMENNSNNYDLCNYSYLLYDVYERKGDYQNALDYYKKSQDYQFLIYKENSDKSILEIQERYNKTQYENLYNLKQQRLKMWLSISILIVIIGIIASIIILQKHKKKKIESEGTIETLNNLVSDSNHSNEKLRKKVIEELELTKKIAYIHATDSDKGKKIIKDYDNLFDRNLQKALDWENLYHLIDDLYPKLRTKLSERYPDLSEKEKQMCYLSRAGFKTHEIAYILGYSRESADTMKCKLRKKSGFNSTIEFNEFLNTL